MNEVVRTRKVLRADQVANFVTAFGLPHNHDRHKTARSIANWVYDRRAMLRRLEGKNMRKHKVRIAHGELSTLARAGLVDLLQTADHRRKGVNKCYSSYDISRAANMVAGLGLSMKRK